MEPDSDPSTWWSTRWVRARRSRPRGVKRKVLPYGALWANIPWPQAGCFSANALEQRYFRASRMAGLLPIGSRGAGEPRMAAFLLEPAARPVPGVARAADGRLET
jgi:hypothetical protein